jgi:uncharacterized protein YdgA (DUF945 family)
MAQGYAYPVGATATSGTAKTVTVSISSANTAVTVFTATKKTSVNSVLVTNNDYGILPVKLYINNLEINSVRVLKTKYAVLPLTATDTRIGDPADPTHDRNKVNTEFILQTGDVLKAVCPIANAVNVTVTMSEGVK